MQIVIPMAGLSERFERAGYRRHKALLEVVGRPIIAHVLDLFPGETDVIFVGNEQQLAEGTELRETVERICPTGRVRCIPAHREGPVTTVLGAADVIDPGRPVVVNYCDFGALWDYRDFVAFTRETGCAGAIPAYRGFHPHSLGSTYYAYLREKDGWVQDIQEKQPFTDQPLQEYASSGTYYFESGELLLSAFAEAQDRALQVNGEHYVSLVYKVLLERQLPVAVYEVPYFMQWGTPDDYEDFLGWSEAFAARVAPRSTDPTVPLHDNLVMTAAGEGRRFADEGYGDVKPLVDVAGRPMFVQATDAMPPAPSQWFVIRRDLPGREAVESAVHERYPTARVITLPGLTRGQAESALLALRELPPDSSVTVAPCDCATLHDAEALESLLADGAEVVVWVTRGHANARRRPEMFGWVDAVDGRVVRTAVKEPLADPAEDPIVIGAFTFARVADAVRAIERLIDHDDTVNGELYLDSTVNHAVALGLDCRVFEVDHYFSWGTPDDLRTFSYWQACFDQWTHHPYSLVADPAVDPEAVGRIRDVAAIHPTPRPSPAS